MTVTGDCNGLFVLIATFRYFTIRVISRSHSAAEYDHDTTTEHPCQAEKDPKILDTPPICVRIADRPLNPSDHQSHAHSCADIDGCATLRVVRTRTTDRRHARCPTP